jgi:hypothetical protein
MESLPTYCLDVLIEQTTLADVFVVVKTPVFILLRVDELPGTARTPHMRIARTMTWGDAFRFIFQLPELDRFGLVSSLCTRTNTGDEIPIAFGRLPLVTLRFDRPVRITFPLQEAADVALQVAELAMIVRMSLVTVPEENEEGSRRTQVRPNLDSGSRE